MATHRAMQAAGMKVTAAVSKGLRQYLRRALPILRSPLIRRRRVAPFCFAAVKSFLPILEPNTQSRTAAARNPERRFTAPFRGQVLDAAILLVIQASNAANTQSCANRE